jgi:epoxyqueuosine reductase QueG
MGLLSMLLGRKTLAQLDKERKALREEQGEIAEWMRQFCGRQGKVYPEIPKRWAESETDKELMGWVKKIIRINLKYPELDVADPDSREMFNKKAEDLRRVLAQLRQVNKQIQKELDRRYGKIQKAA